MAKNNADAPIFIWQPRGRYLTASWVRACVVTSLGAALCSHVNTVTLEFLRSESEKIGVSPSNKRRFWGRYPIIHNAHLKHIEGKYFNICINLSPEQRVLVIPRWMYTEEYNARPLQFTVDVAAMFAAYIPYNPPSIFRVPSQIVSAYWIGRETYFEKAGGNPSGVFVVRRNGYDIMDVETFERYCKWLDSIGMEALKEVRGE